MDLGMDASKLPDPGTEAWSATGRVGLPVEPWMVRVWSWLWDAEGGIGISWLGTLGWGIVCLASWLWMALVVRAARTAALLKLLRGRAFRRSGNGR